MLFNNTLNVTRILTNYSIVRTYVFTAYKIFLIVEPQEQPSCKWEDSCSCVQLLFNV